MQGSQLSTQCKTYLRPAASYHIVAWKSAETNYTGLRFPTNISQLNPTFKENHIGSDSEIIGQGNTFPQSFPKSENLGLIYTTGIIQSKVKLRTEIPTEKIQTISKCPIRDKHPYTG